MRPTPSNGISLPLHHTALRPFTAVCTQMLTNSKNHPSPSYFICSDAYHHALTNTRPPSRPYKHSPPFVCNFPQGKKKKKLSKNNQHAVTTPRATTSHNRPPIRTRTTPNHNDKPLQHHHASPYSNSRHALATPPHCLQIRIPNHQPPHCQPPRPTPAQILRRLPSMHIRHRP